MSFTAKANSICLFDSKVQYILIAVRVSLLSSEWQTISTYFSIVTESAQLKKKQIATRQNTTPAQPFDRFCVPGKWLLSSCRHTQRAWVVCNAINMPTATELDNFRTAPVVHPSSRPESDAKSPGGGKWQQRNNRQRFSKFGITIYGTKRNGRGSTEEWQPTGGGRDSAVTCVTRTQDGVNLCTDILLQPELYLDLFTHRGNDRNSFECVNTYDYNANYLLQAKPHHPIPC